jgi:hypothetical protein
VCCVDLGSAGVSTVHFESLHPHPFGAPTTMSTIYHSIQVIEPHPFSWRFRSGSHDYDFDNRFVPFIMSLTVGSDESHKCVNALFDTLTEEILEGTLNQYITSTI